MASVILGTVGRAVGTAIGGPVGGYIGSAVGSAIGGSIGGGGTRHYEGARLEELVLQSSAYGRMIPMVFGSMRLAGNVIWARPLKELQTTTTTGQGKGGGGGGRSTATSTSYSYYATLAIAICEGLITRVNRIWADAKLLDLSQGSYRIYAGGELQMPDALIESFEGVGATPAYRGLAYIVIEDFPIGDFGNRIPNFTFEVLRQTPQRDHDDQPVEALVNSVMLIPGSGEFVYDTLSQYKLTGQMVGSGVAQQGYQVPLNRHTAEGKANMLVALDQMQVTFPNLQWVGLVVNWFGSSMDIATCSIGPRVEYKDAVQTTPSAWQVGSLTRATATLVGKDGGVARYGGTPDDASIVRLCAELRRRGLKIFFYPMLLMDVTGKPWRGNLTGSSGSVSTFFTKSDGYNAFVTHYASLLAGKIDAFAIGTEMVGVTKITSSTGVFPAVSQLVTLAGTVRSTLGSGVKLTYAADWSEYHHTDGGWYNLDALWASSNIDMVGIDAYFPLTNAEQDGYDVQAIRDGWTSGEGWDFYYTDTDRTTMASLAPAYAWKNIAWWWNNHHVNPNGSTTAWTPGSKPIWFTEYGFASVDGSSNEPNVFIDASSTESAYPRFSRGRIDFMAQRTAITATEAEWAGSSMVANKFLWTWDARPYPHWPDLRSVWADGANWATGHWVQGKLGASHVAAVVEQVAGLVGIASDQVDSTALQMMLDGFIIHERTTARGVLSQLMQAFFFTLIENETGLQAMLVDSGENVALDSTSCIPLKVGDRDVALTLDHTEDLALPANLEVQYLDRLQLYATQQQNCTRSTQEACGSETIRLGLVLSETHARTVADMQLKRRWAERGMVTLQLPMQYAALQPGDRLTLSTDNGTQQLRVEQVQLGRPGLLRIRATRTDNEAWDGYIEPPLGSGEEALLPPSATRAELLDLPAFPGDAPDTCKLRLAACGVTEGWKGATLLKLSDDSDDAILVDTDSPAVIGSCLAALADISAQRIDRKNTLDVALMGDATLASVSEDAMIAGANVALVGDEIIQFAEVTALGDGVFRLGTLLRGRLGTELKTSTHVAGERFVLLNGSLAPIAIGSDNLGASWNLRAVTAGSPFDTGTEFSQTIACQSLKPYRPVHVVARKQTSGDILISWVRRSRLDAAMRDAVDIPLMEEREEYELRILSGTTVLRSWRTTAPQQTYTASQQTTDFGSSPTTLSVVVAQVSARVGLGELNQKTLTVQ